MWLLTISDINTDIYPDMQYCIKETIAPHHHPLKDNFVQRKIK